jgi:hypothetical protein
MMSLLTIAFPAEAALPALQAFAGNFVSLVRPMVGLSVLAAVLLAFRPLLIGLLRAGLLILKPRQTLEQRSARSVLRSIIMLNGMARDLDGAHPSLANELRALASRG